MRNGKDDAPKRQHVDAEVNGEGSGPGLCGLTLRQTVVATVAFYAFVVAVVIGYTLIGPMYLGRGTAVGFLSNVGMLSSRLTRAESNNASVAEQEVPYHSEYVFGLNYEEMMAKFKIFVYPAEEHTFQRPTEGSGAVEFQNTDELFAQLLFESQFVTPDAEAAHLLFLPISTRSLVNDKWIGPGKIGKVLNQYVQRIRDKYPYWWRTLGADHILVNCMEAKEDGSRNVLELKKNAIQVACTPLAASEMFSQTFYPHKDIAMPLHDRTSTDDDKGGKAVTVSPFEKRSKLVYHYGLPDANFLNSLGVSWERDPRFSFASTDQEADLHTKQLSTSKFCLFLGPRDYPNFLVSLKSGCVPVIISDGKLFDLPFQDVLDWSRFTLVVSRESAGKLADVLSSFDKTRFQTMQSIGRKAIKHLQWHRPPQEKDAFYMVLHDLWVRRHAVRYVRRDLPKDEL